MFHYIIFKCNQATLKSINGVASQKGVAGENINQHQASTWKEVSNEKGNKKKNKSINNQTCLVCILYIT